MFETHTLRETGVPDGTPPIVRIGEGVHLGRNVTLRDFVNLYGCTIGDDTRIGAFVEVQRGVTVGCRCKISSHSFLCEGLVLEDDVFIGHGAVFTNDRYPRAVNRDGRPKGIEDWDVVPTRVCRGASIGSNATVLCGVTIGAGAIVGAGSVVTHDVPPGEIWAGNPARRLRRIEAAP